MDLSQYKSITIDGIEMKKLEINGIQVWERYTYTNWVPLSIDTDGNIYNGGLGYKSGYRVRSGGAETAYSSAICTGYIPLKKGDILRISPAFIQGNVTAAVNFFDANFTNLGQIVRSLSDGASEFFAYGICAEISMYDPAGYVSSIIDGVTTLPLTATNADDIAYVRITHATSVTDGTDMIITINEEIK